MYQDIDGNTITKNAIIEAFKAGKARLVHQRGIDATHTNGLLLDGRDWDTRGQCDRMDEECWTRIPSNLRQALRAAWAQDRRKPFTLVRQRGDIPVTHPPLKTTTLRELGPIACKNGYDRLATNLGADYGDDTPITMLQILDSNGLDHALWALARVAGPSGERVCHLAACAFADRVAHLATDPRSHEAVRVKRLWIGGEATDEELRAARIAAWDAAEAAAEAAARAARIAAWDAAWDAPWAAARAARIAAGDTAEAAAEAAAWAAEAAAWGTAEAAAWAAEAAAWGTAEAAARVAGRDAEKIAQVAILRGLIAEYSQ